MGLQQLDSYLESLRDGRRVFYRGEVVPDVTSHPVLGKAIRHAAIDFEMALDPKHRRLAAVDGTDPYSRYYQVPRTAADLRRRSRLIAEGTRLGGTIVPLIHEIGSDALFGLLHASTVIDRQHGTEYRVRVERFLKDAREHDWALAVAQTDVKGDRSKSPSAQSNPDAYVHVVARREDGIVVRGAKVHTSVSVNANRLIVLPTRSMKRDDAEYAVAFAVPLNAPGLTLMASPFLEVQRNKWERPLSAHHAMIETFTHFDNVFVPHDQVFLCCEWEHAGLVARSFVEFHRFTAVSYKLPLLNALVGTASLLAKFNGLAHSPATKESLARLMIYEATVRALLDVSVDRGEIIEPGIFRPEPSSLNLAKHHFATGLHAAFLQVQDIAGGLLVTAPSKEDWDRPDIGPILNQAFAGAVGTGEQRVRLMNLATDLVASDLGAYHLVLAVHAEGSIAAEKMAFVSTYNIAAAEKEAARLAGLGGLQDAE